MRQRLLSEEEHFGALKKSSNIKFPLKVISFIFKSKGALIFIEKLLENMDFQKESKVNYDPHHVISLRKQANKNKPFEHQSVENLAETANLLQFKEDPHIAPITVSENTNILVKRSLSETESMEVDEDGSHKRAKLLESGEMVNEEVSDGFKKVALIPM